MTYDVYGWVEMTAQTQGVGSWQGVLDLSEVAGHPNEVSLRLFGLSKSVHLQETNPAFAERGLPVNLSSEARASLEGILDLEDQEIEQHGFHGFSHATLAEIKQIPISSGTSWDLLLDRITEIQRRHQLTDTQVRIVVWALW